MEESSTIILNSGTKVFKNDFLGKGAFGIVYGCSWNSIPCAAKVLDLKGRSEDILKTIKREQELLIDLKGANNPNIVLVYDVIAKDDKIYIIMEKCDEGDLQNQISQRKYKQQPYTTQEVLAIMKQFLNGYRYCHERNIIHRDLKPANLLVHKGIIKIADLGYAKVMNEINQAGMHSMVGTPAFVAPQILFWQPYSSLADMYSFGVIVFLLLYGQYPMKSNTQQGMAEEFKVYSKVPMKLPDKIGVPDELKRLVEIMLRFNEADRISWVDLFNHDLFDLKVTVKNKDPFIEGQNPPTLKKINIISGHTVISSKSKEQIINEQPTQAPTKIQQDQIKPQALSSKGLVLNISTIEKLISILMAKKELAIRIIYNFRTLVVEKKLKNISVDYHQSLFFTSTMIGYIYCTLKNVDGFLKNSTQQICQNLLLQFSNISIKSTLSQLYQRQDNQKKQLSLMVQDQFEEYYVQLKDFQQELKQVPTNTKLEPQFQASLNILNQLDPLDSDEYYELFSKIYDKSLRQMMQQITDNKIINLNQLKFVYDCEKFLFLEKDLPTKNFTQFNYNHETILQQPSEAIQLKSFIKLQAKRT